MKELREAIGLLHSPNPKYLDPDAIPFVESLQKFAPFIEVQGEWVDESICQLFHSTARDFLVRFPDALAAATETNRNSEDGLRIAAHRIADACLLYLSQHRYEEVLMKRGDVWYDAYNQPVLAETHSFLVYCAKYWDKHLDQVEEARRGNLRDRVALFIKSSNFRTCIQVQSLWVDSQFEVLTRNSLIPLFRRVFPAWFVEKGEGRQLWENYICFLHEWMYFLRCGHCRCPSEMPCAVKPFAGEVDRFWWGALDPRNFLSGLEGRYKTFRFQSDDISETVGELVFDGVNSTGDELKILRLM